MVHDFSRSKRSLLNILLFESNRWENLLFLSSWSFRFLIILRRIYLVSAVEYRNTRHLNSHFLRSLLPALCHLRQYIDVPRFQRETQIWVRSEIWINGCRILIIRAFSLVQKDRVRVLYQLLVWRSDRWEQRFLILKQQFFTDDMLNDFVVERFLRFLVRLFFLELLELRLLVWLSSFLSRFERLSYLFGVLLKDLNCGKISV